MAFGRDDVCEHGSLKRKCDSCALLEADKRIEEMRKILVRVKMYVPDSQQELHARIHRATEQ